MDAPTAARTVLWLDAAALDALAPDRAALVPVLEEVFRERAAGRATMPPMSFFHREGSRWYSSMTSWVPALGHAGCKFQAGDPDNPGRGLPAIQGLYILMEDATSRPVAVMDARWITGRRTAAASAFLAARLVAPGARRLALLGCGYQAEQHVPALLAAVPGLTELRCYDIVAARAAALAARCDGRGGLSASVAASVEAATEDAEIIVTAGPIEAARRPSLRLAQVPEGALVIALDHDSYTCDDLLAAFDMVVTDDRAQFSDKQAHGHLTTLRAPDADFAEMLRDPTLGRRDPRQRIGAFPLGLALEDLATAVWIIGRARAQGLGVPLGG